MTNRWSALGFVCLAGALGSGTARAEIFNIFSSLPAVNATSFTIVLAGNVESSINIGSTEFDPTLNPFEYVNQHQDASFCASNTCTASMSVSLNSGNTVVTYTGTNPLLPGDTFNYGGSGNGEPHFGLDGSAGVANDAGPSLNMLSEAWNALPPLPAVSVNAPPLGPGPVHYMAFFVNVTAGGQTVGDWFEVPYTGGAPQLSFTNTGAGPETLSSAGYFISDTLIPLDQLNFGTEPPPGAPGSTFTPFAPADTTLGPDASTSADNAPEPAMLLPFALCAAGLGLKLRRAR